MRQGNPEFKNENGVDANLSNSAEPSFAIIVGRWNQKFNDEMLAGAKQAFMEKQILESNVHVYYCPGAFEMPVLALNLIEEKEYDALICLGTVVRGDTYHFELVANESARGIMEVSLDTGVPVINGILAVENEEQAEHRALQSKENKGYELALSAIDIADTLKSVLKGSPQSHFS